MTAEEYKKEYDENQNRYYISNMQAEISRIESTIAVYNVWRDTLETYINKIKEIVQDLYDNRNHAETDVTTSDTYDDWVGNKKDNWWSQLGDFVITEFVTYAKSLDTLIEDLELAKTELENKIWNLWGEISNINSLISQRTE